jgi:hypothetical protein
MGSDLLGITDVGEGRLGISLAISGHGTPSGSITFNVVELAAVHSSAERPADVVPCLLRQAPAMCKPILDGFGAGIIGGRGKAEVTKLCSQVSQ